MTNIRPGISHDIIREISTARGEPAWLLEWRLNAFAAWQKMSEPHWSDVDYEAIDYQSLIYYKDGARDHQKNDGDLREIYDRLKIPKHEQDALMGMAVDAVEDSSSVSTSLSGELKKLGIIFLPFGEAVKKHPDLVRENLGSVVPANDNFFAALNAAAFSDGTFVFVPAGVKCPIDLASYFRINTANIGQFERTLIIVEPGAELSYLEGCSAPRRPNHQLHSGVVEVIAKDGAIVKYATVQNWFAGDKDGRGGILNFVSKRGSVGRGAKLLWTQLEIGSAKTWKYPSSILAGDGAHSDFYSLAITRGAQQADTGTKMIHIGNNSTSNIMSVGVALENSRQTFRSLTSFGANTNGAKSASNCDTKIIGENAVANTLPTFIHSNGKNISGHEATTGAISEAALFYLAVNGVARDEAVALIIGGAAAPILSRLPMEFLVESKHLIKLALEDRNA
ncbi:MAG: Fe-S cluster assembly protein SufB [Rickettsiales bacterium]|jgi:Fe-S cluster assembly protein SufB|nr:Fe-S cluster assembly protein SufB [Rickettsiales bacterium]